AGNSGLWVSDGTDAGTFEVQPASGSFTSPDFLTAVGDKVYFVAEDPTTFQSNLWTSDGTSGGTVEIVPASGSFVDPAQMAAVGDRLFFTAEDPSTFQNELWTSDGTPSGTVELTQANTFDLTAVGANLFFFESSGTTQTLWRSDGTGTTQVTGQ